MGDKKISGGIYHGWCHGIFVVDIFKLLINVNVRQGSDLPDPLQYAIVSVGSIIFRNFK